jgi:hypothetical protein
MDREDFTYDQSRDPFWQNYRDQYSALGKMAMEDTMGMASSLTGGYGNSYAQTVGQQAYNDYMRQLNAMLPETYAMSRDSYDAQGDKMLSEISLLDSQRQKAYAEHQDELANWSNWLSYLQGDAQYKEQWQHQLDREAIEDARYAASRSGGVGVRNTSTVGDGEPLDTNDILKTIDSSYINDLKDAADELEQVDLLNAWFDEGLLEDYQVEALGKRYGIDIGINTGKVRAVTEIDNYLDMLPAPMLAAVGKALADPNYTGEQEKLIKIMRKLGYTYDGTNIKRKN